MPHPDTSLVPSSDEIFGWIETICAQGIRRPGYPADVWAEKWIVDRFNELGLQDTRLEPVVLPRWELRSCSLVVWAESNPGATMEFECFALPFSKAAPEGVEAPLAVLGSGKVEDCLALETVTLTQLPQALVRDRLALRSVDPDGDFDSLVQVLPFGPRLQEVMEPTIEAGAAGFIGIFDAPWESSSYYVPYDGISRPIPGVWVSRSDGEQLKAMLDEGPITGRLTVDSDTTEITTHNVIGCLDGASDHWVIVGSHHDGPWISAVEDASGVALVLAQAAYWSRVPAVERPHNMLFLLNSGHMVAGAGAQSFMDGHTELFEKTVLAMHLEHTARECKGEDGKLVPTDDPEVAWWFTTQNDRLVDAVEDALRTEGVRRAHIMPPTVFGEHPPTDGGFAHLRGLPLVDFLAAPMYLFDAQDTLDKIHRGSLGPVTRAAIRILASTAGCKPPDLGSRADRGRRAD